MFTTITTQNSSLLYTHNITYCKFHIIQKYNIYIKYKPMRKLNHLSLKSIHYQCTNLLYAYKTEMTNANLV